MAGASLCTAFALNIATMALIKHTSALTLNVAGVGKDLLLIGYSVVLSGARVSSVQYFGYAIAFFGVTAYSRHKQRLQAQAQAQALADMAEKPGEAEDDDDDELERAGTQHGKGALDAVAHESRTPLPHESRTWSGAGYIGRGIWSGAGARTLSGGEFGNDGERKPLLDLAAAGEAGGEDDLDGPMTSSSMGRGR